LSASFGKRTDAFFQYYDHKTKLQLYNLAKTDKNDVITEVFKSKAILVGSSTINKGILTSVAGIIEAIKGLKFRNK